MTIAGGLALAGEAKASITYDVSLAIGTNGAGIAGTITTDGKNGVIGASDITAWDLTGTGKGGSTLHLVNGPSVVGVGNNTAPFNVNLGTPDLTADANHIYFNFSATDGGWLAFQAGTFLFSGEQYIGIGANNNSDVYQGLAVVPGSAGDPAEIDEGESGNQIIASAATAGTQPNSFIYNNFAAAKLIRFNGNAAQVTTSDGPVLELTPASANQAGSAFTSHYLVLAPNGGFGTFFTFRLSKPGNVPAGGITFTIQSAGSSSLGNSGSGLGYSGTTNSLSVGFDTDNYVAVNINGALKAAYATNSAMNDGHVWYAWIDYSGVRGLLEVRLSESPFRPPAATLAAIVNLPGILGTNNAYVGFTGGTGAGWNQQDILSWKFMAMPTARYIGHYGLTNVSPGFSLTNGLAIKRFTYTVQGESYTNLYGLPELLTKQPDGSVDFLTAPESTPVINANNGFEINEQDILTGDTQDAVELLLADEYADNDPGFVGNGMFLPMPVPVPVGQSFEQSFPAITEANAQSALETVSANQPQLPAPPTNPNQAVQIAFGGVLELLSRDFEDLNTGLQPGFLQRVLAPILPQESTNLLDIINSMGDIGYETSFSGARNCGIATVSEQLLSGPSLSPVLSPPRGTATTFSFAFLTVSNQSYTVWSSTNLAAANWVVYTNFISDGYPKIFTAPSGRRGQGFYRLSSP